MYYYYYVVLVLLIRRRHPGGSSGMRTTETAWQASCKTESARQTYSIGQQHGTPSAVWASCGLGLGGANRRVGG